MDLRDHPKQMLLFFVAQDINDDIRRDVRNFLAEISSTREWVIAPPKLVDARADDDGDETLGGTLEIYSALSPGLPSNIDSAHLEEVSQLVDAVKKISAQKGLAFEFELDGQYVGSIEDGKPDRLLTEGLLGEWSRQLAERRER